MVSSVGIAATAFLLTLQPALAFIAPGTPHSNNIFPRQFGIFNNSNVTSFCPGSSCSVFQTTFSNSPCFGLKCVCTASVVNGLETCIQCAVSVGAIPQSDVTNALNQFIDGCAEGGFPISGLSSGGLSGGNSASLSGIVGDRPTVTVTRLSATGLSTAGPGTSVSLSTASLGSTLSANMVTTTSPASTGTTTSPASTGTTTASASTGTTVTLSAAQNISIISTPVAPVNTGTTVPLQFSAASKMSISTFGITTTTVLGAIALL